MAYPVHIARQNVPSTWRTTYDLYEERRSASTSARIVPKADESRTSPAALADTINVKGISIAGWRIETHRGSIADSKTIDDLSETWGIPLPEMPFDKNRVVLRYTSKAGQEWEYCFDSLSAIRSVDGISEAHSLQGVKFGQGSSEGRHTSSKFGQKPGKATKARVQVAHANGWGKRRDNDLIANTDSATTAAAAGTNLSGSNFGPGVAEALAAGSIVTARDYDWTYTCTWPGQDVQRMDSFAEGKDPQRDRIPIERLGPPKTPGAQAEPILFFDDLVLYEDELGDNGTSLLNVKIRVMPTGFLVLQRFFLRVDNVVFRVFDTRMYVGFYDEEADQSVANGLSRMSIRGIENKQAPPPTSQMRVIRECNGMQAPYKVIRAALPPYKSNDLVPLTDPGWVAQCLTKLQDAKEKSQFHTGTMVSIDKYDPTQPAVLPNRFAPGHESARILGEVTDAGDSVAQNMSQDLQWDGEGRRIDIAIV